jgi:DNA-binding CsgD family transcriptional regulator
MEPMNKSKDTHSWCEGTNIPHRTDPASEQAELLRALRSENQSLRDLVVYLTVTALRNLTPDPTTDDQSDRSIDNKQLRRALAVLSKPFPGHELLTSRERTVLAQISNGATSKEAARTLGISARTVEFHRANILQKLCAKNTTELMRIVLGE